MDYNPAKKAVNPVDENPAKKLQSKSSGWKSSRKTLDFTEQALKEFLQHAQKKKARNVYNEVKILYAGK